MPLEALNTPAKRHLIMPEMTAIASDPIGAFQQISNVLMDVLARLDALDAEVAVLKGDSTVKSSQ